MKKNQQTILYAEDEPNDAFLFEYALRRAGVMHQLNVVPDGRAAISYLADTLRGHGVSQDLPALVLLDVHMPGVSGFDVLEWIRATPSLYSLITLMLSSSHHPRDLERAYALGANGYLVKPCSIEESVAIVKALHDFWLTHNHVPAGAGVIDSLRDTSEAPIHCHA